MYKRKWGIRLPALSRLLATGFYSGFFPFAPGTVGSLVALLPFLLIPLPNTAAWFSIIVLVFFIGVWAATEVEKTHGHDASVIVIDEMVGMWLSIVFLPSWVNGYWLMGAFLIFRLFDIVKPFPAGISQKLPGGWGVMVDDVIAGIYSNLVLRLIHELVLKVF
jgi:phosphatidylglycerophosphatase A